MKAKDWSRVEEVLQDALDCAPHERATYLDETCAGDPALRREVESLLSAYERSDNFMEERLSQVVAELITEDKGVAAVAGEMVGSYKILSPLGAGGMGEVYLARDMKLGRKVALKLLPADLSGDEGRLQRFEQEAQLASNLSHPNICVIHEVNETEDGRHFIVMEYVDGMTLRQYMAEKQIGLSEALDIVSQVASALSAAHEVGVIHRDIKPENIMIHRDSYVKVLDFGVAKLAESQRAISEPVAPTKQLVQTGAGVVIGTVCYMSPEQARGLEVDARTDIFSLGVVLYELITGALPFAGETMSACLAEILKAEPAPLARYLENVPVELERVVRKALEKDKEERYQAIKDFAISLKTLRRELDLKTEIERSASAGEASSTIETTARVSAKNRSANTDEAADAVSEAIAVRRSKSGAEYIVNEVKRHRFAAFIILAVIAVTLAGLAFYLRSENSSTTIDSIAVLPFDNQSHDPDSEYLSDGVTESIINNLARLQDLRVIPRSSTFRYKGIETDPLAVGKELGVRAVLTGRLLRRGDNLIISAELIDVRDDKQLWGGNYSRRIADLLSIQQEISGEVSDKLGVKRPPAEHKQRTNGQTANPEAYQFYLKGRYFWSKRSTDNLKKGIEQFRQALALDKDYALAYSGLADCYLLLGGDKDYPVIETLQKAKGFATRAIQLDESSGEAHTSLAFIYHYLWQWNEADKEFRRAIELSPNYPTAHHWYSFYLRNMGRYDESLVEAKRAQQLDPLSISINANLAAAYLAKGDVDAATEQGKKMAELDERYGHSTFGTVYIKQGRYTEAIAEFQKAVEINGRSATSLADLSYAYAMAGRRSDALAIVKELEKKYAEQDASGIDLARVYTGLGDKDRALDWLEKDFQAHDSNLLVIRWVPELEALRDDERYRDILLRIGQTP